MTECDPHEEGTIVFDEERYQQPRECGSINEQVFSIGFIRRDNIILGI
jgi:hypothetical protein